MSGGAITNALLLFSGTPFLGIGRDQEMDMSQSTWKECECLRETQVEHVAHTNVASERPIEGYMQSDEL